MEKSRRNCRRNSRSSRPPQFRRKAGNDTSALAVLCLHSQLLRVWGIHSLEHPCLPRYHTLVGCVCPLKNDESRNERGQSSLFPKSFS